MSWQSTEACNLCCGIINHITRNLDGSSEDPTGKHTKPPWHETVQQIRESGKNCLLCETFLQTIILPRFLEALQDYPALEDVAVSLRFGGQSQASGIHWANIYTSLTGSPEKFIITRVDSIGITFQPQGKTLQIYIDMT
jgi:hypothetical protein